ncbi:ZIP family metal transporter [Candidatus Pacearchaeota archaeon CG10_big_fil_rev_8_21_14_0_10_34_76]|nr:MAG: ZIP family metal transporter [Candidatus Pacearchaeota archaeon CG10_big_fil_rev_8_21_14_0_10_34_76]
MDLSIWIYTLASVIIVSLISLIGIATLSINTKKLKHFLIYLIAFSAGALFGDAFLHLLPELAEESGLTLMTSFSVLLGIVLFFSLEKLVYWQHCHMPITKEHTHTFATMNLVGDSLHNFLDGIIIGASYLINIPAGIATTIAVALHEIPQEIGDFGVLIHGGFTKTRAIMVNFATALTSILGAVFAITATNYIKNIELFLIPIAIGGFIYIAGSDLIPELHKNFGIRKSFLQLIAFIAGIGVMALLLLLE